MNENLQAFEAANPDIAKWWTGNSFEFAVSLRYQVGKGKPLTQRQFDAAKRCAAKYNQPKDDSIVVDTTGLERAFGRTPVRGLGNPKIRVNSGDHSMVLSRSAKPGVYYVKASELYFGKITVNGDGTGNFEKTSLCTPEALDSIKAALADIEGAAVRYGHKFGICSCCGRPLSNALSVKLGIGPICRGNFFGA